jgi:hypothetical protein
VAAGAQGVPVAAVAVDVWASGAVAQGPSSGVASRRDFDVSRDASLDCHSKGSLGLEVDQTRIHADPNALTSKSASVRWRRSDRRRSIVAADTRRRRSPWRRS